MKGVSIVTDVTQKKLLLQIDVKDLAKNPAKYEDVIEVIVAEERKNEKNIPWETAKKQLKKAGKL
jgi:hypothetical protein